jgi:CheY-like chemotaxis protein
LESKSRGIAPLRGRKFPAEAHVTTRKVLLVDDDVAILLTLKAVLEINGFAVDTAASGREAKHKLRTAEYAMIITDMRMESDEAGIEVVRTAKSAPYNPAIAVLTAFPEEGADYSSDGADELLVKPMNVQQLVVQMESLLVSHEDKKQKAAATAAQAAATPPHATPPASKPAQKSAATPAKKPGRKAARKAVRKAAKKVAAKKKPAAKPPAKKSAAKKSPTKKKPAAKKPAARGKSKPSPKKKARKR